MKAGSVIAECPRLTFLARRWRRDSSSVGASLGGCASEAEDRPAIVDARSRSTCRPVPTTIFQLRTLLEWCASCSRPHTRRRSSNHRRYLRSCSGRARLCLSRTCNRRRPSLACSRTCCEGSTHSELLHSRSVPPKSRTSQICCSNSLACLLCIRTPRHRNPTRSDPMGSAAAAKRTLREVSSTG